eukprot:Pgem_evm1s10513
MFTSIAFVITALASVNVDVDALTVPSPTTGPTSMCGLNQTMAFTCAGPDTYRNCKTDAQCPKVNGQQLKCFSFPTKDSWFKCVDKGYVSKSSEVVGITSVNAGYRCAKNGNDKRLTTQQACSELAWAPNGLDSDCPKGENAYIVWSSVHCEPCMYDTKNC